MTSDATLNAACRPLFYTKMTSENKDDKSNLLKDNQDVYDDNILT